jgi:hypothetical protein
MTKIAVAATRPSTKISHGRRATRSGINGDVR